MIEARGGEQKEAPAVVERWGAPDSSRCVLATSMIDREHDPVCFNVYIYSLCFYFFLNYVLMSSALDSHLFQLLGVARKNGTVIVFST